MDLVIKKLIKKVSETLFPVGIPQGLAIVPRSPKSRSAINCPIGFASDFGRRSVPSMRHNQQSYFQKMGARLAIDPPSID